MSAPLQVPRAARPLVDFAAFVRGFGFAVAPEQTVTFMAAVTLLGPRSLADIRRAAHASLAPPVERALELDTLFDAFFIDAASAAAIPGDADDEILVKDDRGHGLEPPDAMRSGDSGSAATDREFLARRAFARLDPDEQLRRAVAHGAALLPRRRAFRRAPAKSGDAIDLRRTLREALRTDGDLPRLIASRRRSRQRSVLIVIDVSGSMKAHTSDYLRFAHALTQSAERVETFTFGTRLTRITRAMRLRDRVRALDEAAAIVGDWDGGTRIGEALGAFLALPRFAGLARGALALVLSDGLERGDPAAMVDAVRRLSRRAWRLAWLSPLAADERFRPDTAALRAILPWLDHFGDGGSIASLCAYLLSPAAGDERWQMRRWLSPVVTRPVTDAYHRQKPGGANAARDQGPGLR